MRRHIKHLKDNTLKVLDWTGYCFLAACYLVGILAIIITLIQLGIAIFYDFSFMTIIYYMLKLTCYIAAMRMLDMQKDDTL